MEGEFNGGDCWFYWPITGEEEELTASLPASSLSLGHAPSTSTSYSSSSTEAGRELRSPPVKITKKKTRSPGKRSRAAFFTTDPQNFAELVQQVTGSHSPPPAPPPPKAGRLAAPPPPPPFDCVVPTLDTSALWLESRAQSWAVDAAERMLFGDVGSWDNAGRGSQIAPGSESYGWD